MLGEGLAVASRVDDNTSVFEDGGAGEIAEGAVWVVLPSQGLQ
jgi:transketolase N-terminal domain/subunit